MIFGFLCTIYFLNVLSRMLFPMFSLTFAEFYHLSSTAVGNIYLLLALGFGLSLFFSQFVSAKINEQKTIALSATSAGFLLLLFPFMKSFLLFQCLLFLLGSFCGLFLPAAITHLNALFPKEKLGRSIGFFSSFQPLAMIVAPLVRGWIDVFSLNTILSILGTGLMTAGSLFFFSAKRPSTTSSFPSLESLKQIFSSQTNRTMFAFQSLAIALNIGVYTIAPVYFCEMPETRFFSFLSLSRILGIFTSIFCGFLIDFLGLYFSLLSSLLLTGTCTLLLGLFDLETALFAFCLQGPCAIALTTMVYIAISKISAPEKKASLVSLFASTSFLMGAGIVPQIMGMLRDWNLIFLGFIALGGGTLLAGIFLYRKGAIFEEAGG